MRRPRLAVLLATGLIAGGVASSPAIASPDRVLSPFTATNDPATNTSPSQAFVSACSSMGTSKADNDACDKAATVDFTAVWQAEGVGTTFTLPAGFDRLTVPAQLLAISDVERVGRGLTPVLGMSSSLNSLVQTGANNDQDPNFPNPFDGTYGGSNWAGAGNSALLDDFYWMYDDGLGSFNGDCTQNDQSGCWGHRHNIIGQYDAKILMGAAVAYGTGWGTSMATEYIGGDNTDTADVSPTWTTISSLLPPAASITASRSSLRPHHKLTLTGSVMSGADRSRIAGATVTLQRRRNGASWQNRGTRLTSAKGVARFVRHPKVTAKYRVMVRNPSNSKEVSSAPVKVVIT